MRKKKKKHPVPPSSREICSINREQACVLLYEKGVSRVKKMTQHRAERLVFGRERCGGADQEGVVERRRRKETGWECFFFTWRGKLMPWKPGEPFSSSAGDPLTPITWYGWVNNCTLCGTLCVCVYIDSAGRQRSRHTRPTLICLPSTIQLPATSCLQPPSHRYCSRESWVWPAWEEELWERNEALISEHRIVLELL